MTLTDTHTHLYLEQFDGDREEVIRRALDNSVRYMILPNIDSSSTDKMMGLCSRFPGNCFPMMGLHPTSVDDNYREELGHVRRMLEQETFYAIGETGIDLYWDKTFKQQQEEAFRMQIRLAKEKKLPIVIHSRNSFNEIFRIMDEEYKPGLRGVFHCFTGNLKQAEKIAGWGFMIGIGGVLTFKNSGLDKVAGKISLDHIILETDSPFLAPAPYRGKRNESAYLRIIAEKLAEVSHTDIDTVADITTRNAMELFKFNQHEHRS